MAISRENVGKWVFISVIFAIFVSRTAGQVACGGNFGDNNNAAQTGSDPGITTESYMLEEDSACCGKITQYDVGINGAGNLYLQVWADTATANTYTLSDERLMPNAGSGSIETFASPLRIAPGWRIGWRGDGGVTVKMKTGGGGASTARYQAAITTISTSHSWAIGPATASAGSEFPFRIYVTAEGSDPYFIRPTGQTISILDSTAVNDVIYTATWTDPDALDVPNLVVTMTETTTSYFAFDDTTGDVTVNAGLTDILKAGGTGSPVSLSFSVTDVCGNLATGTLTVEIVNVPPTITNLPYDTTIPETSSVAASLYTISVTDPSDTPTCSTSSAGPFTVDLVGTDYVINYVGGFTFDYDTQFSYPITVDCTDDKDTVSSVFTVYLTRNEPPVITNLPDSVTISANDAVNTAVFTVTSTDFESDTLTYALTCDEATCPFTIINTGAMTLNTDLSTSTLVGYDVSVTVDDGNTLVGPKVLTVYVADINDIPVITNLPTGTSLSVMENTATGSPIFDVECRDANVPASQTLTFTMTSTDTTAASYFTIDAGTGLISTASSVTNFEVLDAAGTSSFVFTVACSDGAASSTVTLTLTITNMNEAPTFDQNGYSITATEGAAGTDLGSPNFGVTDPDSGDTQRFTQNCGSDTGYFLMSPTDGRLSLLTLYDLDSGSLATTIYCKVTVTDSGDLTGTTSLTIYISGINDNNPVFSPPFYSFFAGQGDAVSTHIGTVTAIDLDTGTHGSFTYTLDQTSLGSNYFSIDSTGQIFINQPLSSFAAGTVLSLQAQAADSSGVTYTANVEVTISETTTVTPVVTEDRYISFFEDRNSVAWFTACLLLLVTIAATTALLCFKGYIPFFSEMFAKCFKPTRNKMKRPKLKRFRAPNRRVELPPRQPTPPPPTPKYIPPPTPVTPPRQLPAAPKGFDFWSDGDIHQDPGI